jgi:hypothetical protein
VEEDHREMIDNPPTIKGIDPPRNFAVMQWVESEKHLELGGYFERKEYTEVDEHDYISASLRLRRVQEEKDVFVLVRVQAGEDTQVVHATSFAEAVLLLARNCEDMHEWKERIRRK